MTKSVGHNLTVVKAHNLSAILLRLLRNETVSRVELANELSLTSSTISNLAAELLDDGIITEVEVEETYSSYEEARSIVDSLEMMQPENNPTQDQ